MSSKVLRNFFMEPYILKTLYITGGILGFSVVSEIVWQSFLRCYRAIKPEEINEVVFTNDNCKRVAVKTKSGDAEDAIPEPAILLKIVECIEAACESIHVCIYIFTVKRIADALLAAHKRGVKVRIVGEGTMAYSSGSAMQRLHKEIVPIRIWGGKNNEFLMHHKFCLIDADWSKFELKCPARPRAYGKMTIPAQGILITGSSNWTMQALTGNCENILVTSNKVIVERHQAEFQRLWFECGQTIT